MRMGRADVEALHLFCRVAPDRGIVHQHRVLLVFRVVVIAEGHVLPGLEVEDQPFALAVFRHMRDAARAAGLAVGIAPRQVDLVAVDADRARRPLVAAEHFEELRLPVAGDAGDAHDLARRDVETDALQPLDPGVVLDAQVLDLEHSGADARRCLVDAEQDLAAHHQLGQLFGRGLGGLHGRRHLAPPHHADRVGHMHDLAELVGDEDDRLPLGLQPFEDAEQVVGLGGRQHAGRLIQDQYLGAAIERLQDLDALLHADADILDLLVRIDREAVFVREPFQDAAGLGQGRAQEPAILGAEDDVLEDREILHQLEMLENHADARGDGGLTVGDLGLFSGDEDLARIGLVEAVEDRHQRRLARAVLADDPVDRPRHDADGNVLVGLYWPEGLGNAPELDRRCVAHPSTPRSVVKGRAGMSGAAPSVVSQNSWTGQLSVA